MVPCLCEKKDLHIRLMKVLSREQVRLHLLTAAMKCFFKRAPETQKALGIALAAGIADFHQVSSDLPLPNSLFLKPLAH